MVYCLLPPLKIIFFSRKLEKTSNLFETEYSSVLLESIVLRFVRRRFFYQASVYPVSDVRYQADRWYVLADATDF